LTPAPLQAFKAAAAPFLDAVASEDDDWDDCPSSFEAFEDDPEDDLDLDFDFDFGGVALGIFCSFFCCCWFLVCTWMGVLFFAVQLLLFGGRWRRCRRNANEARLN